MKPTRSVVEVLEPVLDAARAVLRDLEAEEVPAGVVKVARHSGKKLPPPYARRLVAELDENDWLRDKVTDRVIDADPDADDRRLGAAGLFLHRPDGWESRFSALVDEQESTQAGSRAAGLEQEVARLTTALEVAKDKEKKARQAADRARADADRRVKELRAALDSARSESPGASADLADALASAEADVARLRSELTEADGKIDSLKQMLLKARRSESVSEGGGGPSVWQSSDPLDKAKLLDEVMTAMRPGVVAPGGPGPAAAPLQIPEGVRPDQIDAIHWLLQQNQPLTLVVDGYNVTYELDPSLATTSDLRERVRDGLTRLRRLARGALPTVLIFDSQEEESVIPGPVEVRFVSSADDEIVRLSSQLAGNIVVVSTDREVRERAEHNGAIALWSESLVEWMRGRK